ncbi:Aromatic ring-opening dioxygenase, catalytic subunit, LigB family [Acidaminobacter hydrogenoformans DSM 2784]|uniref:Aromatic ring-opening dioxygenase, catalytic subunit, LigB family n=2 Tax=Acidaminobacter TaxID=65402 RepID=A0A1G5S4U8_9FIRM|nr:Aromatic ring-opening dioxygenase, catalytic subunit, LigB family [Acidaminobacter hydrogenoformans DSM 2784]
MRMPALFIGHGSPMNAIEDNAFTKGWRHIAGTLPRPTVILSVSAHWYTRGTRISSEPAPRTIHDMYGFPAALYQIVYDAPGAPDTSDKIRKMIPVPVVEDNSWGLDHGTWSVLHVMYPERDIPVLQLSIDANTAPENHLKIGRALSRLRDEGVMILGSGNVVHNLRRVRMDMPNGFDWAYEFDGYIRSHIEEGQLDAVLNHKMAGPCAELAFETREHYDPLLYVLGASREDDELTVFNEACVMGSVSMTSYVFQKQQSRG